MNKLEVLYEDNHLIVVVKQANVPSQQDSSNDLDLLTIVKKYIKEKYHKPGNVYIGLIHRLDRPVSGIMVFARTSKAASRLSDQIRKNQFTKKYLAVVQGIIKNDDNNNYGYVFGLSGRHISNTIDSFFGDEDTDDSIAVFIPSLYKENNCKCFTNDLELMQTSHEYIYKKDLYYDKISNTITIDDVAYRLIEIDSENKIYRIYKK